MHTRTHAHAHTHTQLSTTLNARAHPETVTPQYSTEQQPVSQSSSPTQVTLLTVTFNQTSCSPTTATRVTGFK